MLVYAREWSRSMGGVEVQCGRKSHHCIRLRLASKKVFSNSSISSLYTSIERHIQSTLLDNRQLYIYASRRIEGNSKSSQCSAKTQSEPKTKPAKAEKWKTQSGPGTCWIKESVSAVEDPQPHHPSERATPNSSAETLRHRVFDVHLLLHPSTPRPKADSIPLLPAQLGFCHIHTTPYHHPPYHTIPYSIVRTQRKRQTLKTSSHHATRPWYKYTATTDLFT